MNTQSVVVELNGEQLIGHEAFYDTFVDAFGFPDFYGRNMDAWIDSMSCLDDRERSMSDFVIEKGSTLTLKINNYPYFKKAGQSEWLSLIECSAFVNFRRSEIGVNPLIALAFHD